MVDNLLRVSLQRLHDRLSELIDADVPLTCWLIEWPSMERAAKQTDKPGLSDATVVWESVSWEAVDWELSASEPYQDHVDREPFRALHLSTRGEGVDRLRLIFKDTLKPIFVDAGTLLATIPTDALPVPSPPVTTRTGDWPEPWLYYLFDLAWAEIPGSPLRAHKTPDFCGAIDEHRNTLDPPCWYSRLDTDVVQASIYASTFC